MTLLLRIDRTDRDVEHISMSQVFEQTPSEPRQCMQISIHALRSAYAKADI